MLGICLPALVKSKHVGFWLFGWIIYFSAALLSGSKLSVAFQLTARRWGECCQWLCWGRNLKRQLYEWTQRSREKVMKCQTWPDMQNAGRQRPSKNTRMCWVLEVCQMVDCFCKAFQFMIGGPVTTNDLHQGIMCLKTMGSASSAFWRAFEHGTYHLMMCT